MSITQIGEAAVNIVMKLSLQHKAIIFTSILITLVCIASLSIFVWLYTSNERQKLSDSLNVLLDIQSDVLAKPLWGLDREEIDKLLRVMAGDDLIAHVEVWTQWGDVTEPFAASGQYENGDPDAVAGERDIVQPESGEVIGRLKLVLSSDHVQFAIETITFIGIGLGIVIIGISVAVICLGFAVFTRPLRVLNRAMQRLSEDDVDVDIPFIGRPDEIGAMAASIDRFKTNAIKVREMTGELREQAARLTTALDRERDLNALQRQFVTMVSHEFRTPLAIIDGAAKRLGKITLGTAADDLGTCIQVVQSAVIRLTGLIESSLSAVRLDEGAHIFDPRDCDIAAIVAKSRDEVLKLGRNHHFDVDLDRLPSTITADPKLVQQIVTHLLSNAIKYSPEGATSRVEGCRRETRSSSPFAMRGSASRRTRSSDCSNVSFEGVSSVGIAGTGVGLFLVKTFVDMHGGSVSVQRVEEGGARFCVRLPIRCPKDPGAPADSDGAGTSNPFDIDERMFLEA